MPWLFDKVNMFIHDDEMINKNAHEIVETGIRKQQKDHDKKLFDLIKKKKDTETKVKENKIRDLKRK